MSYGAGGLWLAAGEGRAALVTRIDPQTDRATPTAPGTCSSGSAWRAGTCRFDAADDEGPRRRHQGPRPACQLRIEWPDLTDPAVAAAPGDNGNSPLEQQLQFATCARLLTFPATNGAAHRQLMPEVATSLPTLSADRRTVHLSIAADIASRRRPTLPSQRPRLQVLDRARAVASARCRRAGPQTDSRHRRGPRLPHRKGRPHRRHHRARGHTRDSPGTPGARLPRTNRGLVLLPRPDRHPPRLPVRGRGRARTADPLRRPVLLDR